MLPKHWSVWMILAFALSGCKTGGLTPTWSNPLAFLMPKKTSEPEKPSTLASPTPIKPGYSSANDRALSQSNTDASPTGQPLSSGSRYSSSSGSGSYGNTGSAAGNRYGGNMAYGSPSSGGTSSSGATAPPYGAPSYGPSAGTSMNTRSGISPQVGRYDLGPGYGENPPLTASRASAAGYTGRDSSAAGTLSDRYGGSYSGSSPSSPNWRSWENASSRGSSSPSDPLARPEGYDRTSSWSSGTDRYGTSGYSRSSSSTSLGERTGGTSNPTASWGRSSESSPGSSSTSSRSGYNTPSGYRSTDSASPEASRNPSYSNPYFPSQSRESYQQGPGSPSAGSTPRSSEASWGTPRSGGTSSPTGDPSYRSGDTQYRPGDTGYRPGDTGYQPGNTGYRPGDTGYNPPNTSRYQMPGTSTTSSGSSSASSGEYRPGSTRSYQLDQSP